MRVQYRKLHPDALTPRRAHAEDAGLDLAPIEEATLHPGATVKLRTGIAMAIPPGYFGLLVGRSSAKARGLDITSVIDPGYRGDIIISVTNVGLRAQHIEQFQYLAQLLILPCATPGLELVTELEPSARGEGGFGSSDEKAP